MNNKLKIFLFGLSIVFGTLAGRAQSPAVQLNGNSLSIKQRINGQSLYTSIVFLNDDQVKINTSGEKPGKKKTQLPTAGIEVFDNGMEAILQSNQVKVVFDKKSQFLSIIRLPNEVLWKGYTEIISHPETEKQVIQLVAVECADEHYLGLGERLNGYDQKGKLVKMDLYDAWSHTDEKAYKSIPFYMSSRNYGVLVNSAEQLLFDMGAEKQDITKVTMRRPEIEWFLFANNSPLEVMEQYTDITGKNPLIPFWSLEPWYSRRRWNDTETAKKDIDQLDQYGIHFGVVLWESLLHEIRTEPDQVPTPFELIDYWHSKDKKVVFWDLTGQVQDTPENLKKYGYDKAPVKNYFLRDKNNNILEFSSSGETVNPDSGETSYMYIDSSNPHAMAWWMENIYGPKLRDDNGKSGPNGYNLDGVKIDFCELISKGLEDYVTYKPTPGIENVHSVMYAEEVYKRIQEIKPEGGITWTRGGGLGIQRGGIFWNGDRLRNFSQLKGTVLGLMAASISGLGYAGHDLGGYIKADDPEAEENYIRGAQFATFSPFFHDHGTAQAPREQNKYGRDNYGFYTRVRYNLIPYLSDLVVEANRRGWPMMRPMFYYHPNDQKTWKIDDQYYLGNDLLVAPVLAKGTSRIVYLPDGEWIDFWTHEKFSGNQSILVNKELNKIPVFVKKNSVLNLSLNKNLEIGGHFKHMDKHSLLTTYKLFSLEAGSTMLSEHKEKNPVLRIEHSENAANLFFENIEEDFALIIPQTLPSQIKINGAEFKASGEAFENANQGWKFDNLTSELKLKVKAVPNVTTYKIELVGLGSNKIQYVQGETVAEMDVPATPVVTKIEDWNGSVDLEFAKDDRLGERYVIGYGLNNSETADNRAYLNYGNKITIDGLENGKRYFFRIWAENQFHRSLETDWWLAHPTDEKRPVHTYDGKFLFIKGNHCTSKTTNDKGVKNYTFTVTADKASKVQLWIKRNQHLIHNDYDKWYKADILDLKKSDTITVEVAADHSLRELFIAPLGEDPFYKD
ncbi:TIM-barrel domain-containing protein [Mariniphaga sediminis]|uniref:TIM-barrel domain-containing protein n=1 Tax=Mariniphaga sediminis TaxID=1628158 RepID=UPI0035663C8F